MLGWLIYQRAIFGSFLHFSRSQYSARVIDVIGANKQFAVHKPIVALDQYFTAVQHNIPLLILIFSVCGLLLYFIRCLLSREHAFAPIYLLGIPLFFVTSLTLGQNAIDMRYGKGFDLNIRYGTTILPLIAFGVGYLVAMTTRCGLGMRMGAVLNSAGRVAAVGLVAAMVVVAISLAKSPRENTAVLDDVAAQRSPDMELFASTLDRAWDGEGGRDVASVPGLPETLMEVGNPDGGGRILADGFGAINGVQLFSGVPLRYFVTESSPVLYDKALADPQEHHVEWAIIRKGDALDQYFASAPERLASLVKVFENDFGRLYYVKPE